MWLRGWTLAYCAWALTIAGLGNSSRGEPAAWPADGVVSVTDAAPRVEAPDADQPDYMDALLGRAEHVVGPEFRWSGRAWLRPFKPIPPWGWNASIDMMMLVRDDPNDLTLVQDTDTRQELLNAGDKSFGGELGPRFRIGGRLPGEWRFEFSIFGVDGWRTRAALPGPQWLRLPGPDAGDPFVLATSPLIDYRSTLGSQELNFGRDVGQRLTVLAGFRSIQLEEWFSTSSFLTRVYEVSTDNRLYGFQLGADYQLVRNRRMEVGMFVRGGVFNNDAVAETLDPTGLFAATPQNASLRAVDQGAAFAGEAGLVASLRLWEFVYLRGGYQVLHLESVALAPDQLPLNAFAMPNDPLTASSGIDSGEGVFYHGATAGLEVRW